MPLPFTATQLKQNVDHDIAACTTLLTLLKEEQEALKNREADKVDSLIDKKVPLLDRLEASSKLRQAWAANANTASTEEGWANMLTELGDSSIQTDWATLKQLYIDVRNQNEVNGKLLSRHQSTIKRLLDVMRGNTSNTPNLYNSTGYASSSAQGNKVGEA